MLLILPSGVVNTDNATMVKRGDDMAKPEIYCPNCDCMTSNYREVEGDEVVCNDCDCSPTEDCVYCGKNGEHEATCNGAVCRDCLKIHAEECGR